MSKRSFRKQLRQNSNYQSNAQLNFETILTNSGVKTKDISNFKLVSKDHESIKILNLTNNNYGYIRY